MFRYDKRSCPVKAFSEAPTTDPEEIEDTLYSQRRCPAIECNDGSVLVIVNCVEEAIHNLLTDACARVAATP